jgi:hypothetical protein
MDSLWHLDLATRNKVRTFKLLYNPIFQFLDKLNFVSIRNEGLHSGTLLYNIDAKYKTGFDNNIKSVMNASRLNNSVPVYVDDIIEPKNTQSYDFVDLIITSDELNNHNEVDVKNIIKRITHFAPQSLHHVRIGEDFKKEPSSLKNKEFWLQFNPTSYATFNGDNHMVFLLKH